MKEDYQITFGKNTDDLNVVIHIPKTEARSTAEDINLKNLLEQRIQDKTALAEIMVNYKGKKSSNIKKMIIKADVFDLNTNELIGSGFSSPIVDKGSQDVGALDINDATEISTIINKSVKYFIRHFRRF